MALIVISKVFFMAFIFGMFKLLKFKVILMVWNCISFWLRISYKAARVSELHQLILNVRSWPITVV